jgi:hypothetical protein
MDCLGAIDSSHIPIAIKNLLSADQRVLWRCRKGFLSQNVMAAVDFDMNFLYILPGWEGSAHDSRVLKDALEKGFSAPPGRYDAGYAAILYTFQEYVIFLMLYLTPFNRHYLCAYSNALS